MAGYSLSPSDSQTSLNVTVDFTSLSSSSEHTCMIDCVKGINPVCDITFTLTEQTEGILFITVQKNTAFSISNSSIYFSSILSTPGHLISAYDTLMLSSLSVSLSSSSLSSSPSILTHTNTPIYNSDDSSSSSEYSDICLWSGGAVLVSGMNSDDHSFAGCSFTNITYGAIRIDSNTSLTISDIFFENNNPSLENFPSFRKNIVCINSTLSINTPAKGDGSEATPSLWIASDGCTVSGTPSSPFFIPTLTRASATLDPDTKYLSVTFTGQNLIPCDLMYRITFNSDILSTISTFESETKAIAELNSSDYDRYVNSERVGVSLVYGTSHAETSIYWLKETDTQTNPESNAGIIVAVVLPLFLLVIGVVLIVLYCIFHRHTPAEEEKGTEKQSLITEQKTFSLFTPSLHYIAPLIADMMDNDEDAANRSPYESRYSSLSSTGSTMHHSVYVIPSSSPHTLVPLHEYNPLASIIHTQSERDKHNERWGVRVALQVCDIASYLMSVVYPSHSIPHSPSSILSLAQFRWMLHSINPHTLVFTQSHQVALAYIDGNTPIIHPSSSTSTHIPPSSSTLFNPLQTELNSSPLSEEVKRFQCKELLLQSKTESGRRESEMNCVYAIGLIMYEIVSDEDAFKDMRTPDVVKFVIKGGVPELNGLRGKNESVTRIIRSILTPKGNSSLTIPALKDQLEKCIQSMDGEMITDKSEDGDDHKHTRSDSSSSSS